MDDDDECEFEYEEEDDYQIEDDGDEDMIDDDAEVEVENKYYNAKGEVDDCPKEAYNMLLEVLEREKENGSPGKWTFKALKQLVKCSFKLKKFDEMRQRYKELLEFSWPGLTRNHTEKAINKCLDVASTAGAQVLQSLYEITLERLGKDTKNQEKLWFNIKLKLANLFFETRDFNVLRGMVTELKNWCRDADGSYDVKKGTQLLTVYSLEIQMQTELKDYKTLKTLYSESLEVESAIPPPRILGIIRECGGKMFMRQGNWEDANSAFFQAFKNYDEAGHPRRIQCLKYLVLANMLASSNINPFDSTEAKPYKNDTEIVAMTDLIDAYGCNDIKRFERILKDNRSTIVDDPFIKGYIDPLLKTIRTQVLLDICKPYTRIRIPFISQELNIVDEEVEALLVGLILDNRLVGFIDQVNQLLHLGGSYVDMLYGQAKHDSRITVSSIAEVDCTDRCDPFYALFPDWLEAPLSAGPEVHWCKPILDLESWTALSLMAAECSFFFGHGGQALLGNSSKLLHRYKVHRRTAAKLQGPRT